jgi:hypothetical protein
VVKVIDVVVAKQLIKGLPQIRANLPMKQRPGTDRANCITEQEVDGISVGRLRDAEFSNPHCKQLLVFVESGSEKAKHFCQADLVRLSHLRIEKQIGKVNARCGYVQLVPSLPSPEALPLQLRPSSACHTESGTPRPVRYFIGSIDQRRRPPSCPSI